MSNIRKEWKVVNDSGLRVPEWKQHETNPITARKGKIRSSIESAVRDDGTHGTADGELYDRDDQLADLSNAFEALLAIAETNGWNTTNVAIDKYKGRKGIVDTVVGAN